MSYRMCAHGKAIRPWGQCLSGVCRTACAHMGRQQMMQCDCIDADVLRAACDSRSVWCGGWPLTTCCAVGLPAHADKCAPESIRGGSCHEARPPRRVPGEWGQRGPAAADARVWAAGGPGGGAGACACACACVSICVRAYV